MFASTTSFGNDWEKWQERKNFSSMCGSPLLRRAADLLWPRAILSKSALILGLAKIAAEDALKPLKGTPRKQKG